MSVQSSLDPYGSNTTLASSASSEMDSGRKSSGGAEASGSASGEQALGSPQQKIVFERVPLKAVIGKRDSSSS